MSGETIAMVLLLAAGLPFILLKLWAVHVWEPRRRAEDAVDETGDADADAPAPANDR